MPTPPRAAVPPSESAPLELTSMNLGRLYLPGGGLGYSFLIHGIVLTVVQLLGILSVVDSLTEGFPPGQGAMGSRSDVRMVMYLPSMGGGGQGEGGGSESSANQPTPAPSSGTEGLVFPGPQVIHSDSPLPNNRFQTLLQPELEDLPILEGRLDLPNFLSMPEALYIAKPEQEQPADPSEGVAAEPVQAQLEDLPISKRRLDVDDLFLMPEVPDVETEPVQAQLEDLPISKRHLDLSNLLSMPEVGAVPWSAPVQQAVGLPDTVKPEEPEPVDPSDGVTEPVQAELADLPFLKRSLDVPNRVSMVDLPETVEPEEEPPVDEVTEPVQAELADLPLLERRLDLPDTVEPEEEQPVDPPDDVAEPVQAELADLPFLKRRLDLPDAVKPEEEQPVDPPDDVATEPVQRSLADLPIFKLRLDLPKTDRPNILALTPMPTALEAPVEIPVGEARGRFTIAPEPNLDTSETEPGSPSAVVPGDQGVGLGGENALSTSIVNLTLGPGVGAKGKGSSSGGGGDIGPGSGPGSGVGSGIGSGAGSGPGTGPFAGITIVGGVGGAGPSGSGTGSGSGTEPFDGITIVGGVWGDRDFRLGHRLWSRSRASCRDHDRRWSRWSRRDRDLPEACHDYLNCAATADTLRGVVRCLDREQWGWAALFRCVLR